MMILSAVLCVVVMAAVVDFALWFRRYLDWQDSIEKTKQIPLDDIIGTEKYHGPLG